MTAPSLSLQANPDHARALALGWGTCAECLTPYRVEDLCALGPDLLLCRWHARHLG